MSREIDAKIAEHVMGGDDDKDIPPYSSDMSVCFRVLEKLKHDLVFFRVSYYFDNPADFDLVEVVVGREYDCIVVHESIAMAICLASLEYFGIDTGIVKSKRTPMQIRNKSYKTAQDMERAHAFNRKERSIMRKWALNEN